MRSRREQRHSSIIYSHGNPVAFGYNTNARHAEEEVIGALHYVYGKEPEFKRMTVVNIRITAGGRIGLAKPCPACLELLRNKRFRKVIYSTNDGSFKELYL